MLYKGPTILIMLVVAFSVSINNVFRNPQKL
jgi:hypothetical protein